MLLCCVWCKIGPSEYCVSKVTTRSRLRCFVCVYVCLWIHALCIVNAYLNVFLLVLAEKQLLKVKTTQNGQPSKPDPTWIHDIFQGTFTSETRCLNCETVCVELKQCVIGYVVRKEDKVGMRCCQTHEECGCTKHSPLWPSLGWERLLVVTLKGRY